MTDATKEELRAIAKKAGGVIPELVEALIRAAEQADKPKK